MFKIFRDYKGRDFEVMDNKECIEFVSFFYLFVIIIKRCFDVQEEYVRRVIDRTMIEV